jgi:hypothetical protein
LASKKIKIHGRRLSSYGGTVLVYKIQRIIKACSCTHPMYCTVLSVYLGKGVNEGPECRHELQTGGPVPHQGDSAHRKHSSELKFLNNL